jgi:hypothetical protein
VLSLDAGDQSLALLLLSVEQDIPPFDIAIINDRPDERRSISAEHARIQQIAIKAGVPILRLASDHPPLDAIKVKIREILGYPYPRPVPAGVVAELVIGVALDQIHLATDSEAPYIRHCFPLLDLGWTRRECQGYLRSLKLESTPRSTRLCRGRSR